MADLELDGIGFYNSWQNQSTADRFVLLKDEAGRDRYLDLLRRHQGGRILELGIYQGGSAALAMLAAEPAKLVAIDISEPVEALETFRTRRGLADRLRTRYRFDQADRSGLARILDDEFGDDPIDLVVDDASHLFEETVASFEVAFPRLRPGGEFVIEDWAIGPGAGASTADLLASDDFDSIDFDSSFVLVGGAKDGSLLHGPVTAALQRARTTGGPAGERAQAIVDQLAWPIENHRTTTLAAMVAGLAAVTASRPGEIERFECTQDLITVVRGPAELPRTGWRLERHPGEALELLGLDNVKD